MAKSLKITEGLITEYMDVLRGLLGKSIDCVPQLKGFDAQRKTRIIFSKDATMKMLSLLLSQTGEVGWHGIVERLDDGFFIKDIFIYPQYVTGATVTTEDDEYNKWMLELNDDEFNTMRFHGHSHVNMGVTPSATDLNHRKDILSRLRPDDYYIFLIINKSLEMTAAVYDMANNVEYDTKDIDIELFSGYGDFFQDIVNKVKRKTYETTRSYTPAAETPYTGASYATQTYTEKKSTKEKKKKTDAKPMQTSITPLYPRSNSYYAPASELDDQSYEDYVNARKAVYGQDYERYYGYHGGI